MSTQTRIDASTRTVLQAIHGLQFTGRENRDCPGMVHTFDPVPKLAIQGELFGIVTNIESELRKLQTLGLIEHADEGALWPAISFVRPDGKVVALRADDEPPHPALGFGDIPHLYYAVAVNGQIVSSLGIPGPSDADQWRESKRRMYEAYRVTASGLAVLQDAPSDDEPVKDTPTDLITLSVAVKRFNVSRPTLQRLIDNGDVTSYRTSTHKNAQHQVSEADIAARYPRK